MRTIRISESVISLTLLLMVISLSVSANGINLYEASKSLPHICGTHKNKDYLYVTAGNRLYCIGNQSGDFPKVGFHTPGQMGGIWQQPIKLLDGFRLNLIDLHSGHQYENVCDSFITYPFTTLFKYHIPEKNIIIARTQFVPDNLPVLVVEYNIENKSDKDQSFLLNLNLDVNLMPVWLGDKCGMYDQSDLLMKFDKTNSILYFRDKANPWFAGIGFENKNMQVERVKPTPYKDNGITGGTSLNCFLQRGKSYNFRFYISGSILSIKEIERNIIITKSRLVDLFSEKKQRFEEIGKTARISLPDKELENVYNWGKYSTDWLVRDVPGIGRGMSAGLPDYPWFFSNDQASTFMALTGIMKPQLFYDSFKMLKQISNKVNNNSGRIIHEVSTNGVVYDRGRMEESQLHIIAAWQIFKWTGNLEFLKENYAFAKKTWNWLQQHDTNHNGYIEGYGGAEIEGLNDEMLDVQVNTVQFLEIISQMAFLFGDKVDAANYAQRATKLKVQINNDWWVESENRYADFITSKEKALKIIDDALLKRVQKGRNDWAERKLKSLKQQIIDGSYTNKGYVVYYNPSGLQPMEIGMTDTLRAKQMLNNALFFTNKFGAYITGIERPDDITIDEKAFQKDTAFTYNRAVMSIATSELAQAAARFGMPDTALMYMHKIINSFSFATPGTIYEISPDYGMFVQAWNITGINIPLIHYFFGIQPDAYKKEITIHLQMPESWEYATLNDLLIGNAKLSLQYKKKNNLIMCNVCLTKPDWIIHFVLDANSKNVIVNEKMVISDKQSIDLRGTNNTIQFTLK